MIKRPKMATQKPTKNFKVDPEQLKEEFNPSQLIPDLKHGFSTARRNNQPLLALEYLDKILEIIDDKLDELLDEKKNSKTMVNKPASVPATKKVSESVENAS